MAEQDGGVITNALAEYFGCDPEEIGPFVVGVERSDGENSKFSTVWSAIPHWYLLGFVNELNNQIEQSRNRASLESMLMIENGGDEDGQV